MRKNSILGQRIYFAEPKKREVISGVVLSSVISQSGYVVHIVLDDEGVKHSVEDARLFEKETDAKAYLPMFLDIGDEMQKLADAHEKHLDSLREKIIGKPEFKELADGIFGKK